MAQQPTVCSECKFYQVSNGRCECYRHPPQAAPSYDAPKLWEYPEVRPNRPVCGDAERIK